MFDDRLDLNDNERWERRKRHKEQERLRFGYEEYEEDFEESDEPSSRKQKRQKFTGDFAPPVKQKGKKAKHRPNDLDY